MIPRRMATAYRLDAHPHKAYRLVNVRSGYLGGLGAGTGVPSVALVVTRQPHLYARLRRFYSRQWSAVDSWQR